MKSLGKLLKHVVCENKAISINIVGTFMVKGGAMVVNLLAMPAYMRYFQDQAILGVWFTLLSLLNWVFMFDLGIGHGLRNKLAEAIAQKRENDAREYVVSAYSAISVFALIVGVLLWIVLPYIPWNDFFNITREQLPPAILLQSMRIVAIGIIVQFVLRLITSILYALQMSAIVNFLYLMTNVLIFAYVRFAPDQGAEQNLIALSWVQILAANIPLALATLFVFVKNRAIFRINPRYFRKEKAREVLRIGIVLLWVQLVWMVVSGMHSILITRFISPEAVVEYQVYYKVFTALATVFTLSLTPIWSAVTKAQAEMRFDWVRKVYIVLLVGVAFTSILEFCAIPFLQFIVNFWLGPNVVVVKRSYALLMAVFSTLFILHNVNTSIANGMSQFKVQGIWMGFSAVLMIPISYYFCNLTGDWVGVIMGFCLSVLPYEIIQPICAFRHLKSLLHSNGANN